MDFTIPEVELQELAQASELFKSADFVKVGSIIERLALGLTHSNDSEK